MTDREQLKQLVERITEVKNRHADSLLEIPGVTGVGVGFIFKGGERTREIGIVVLVERKLPRDQVPPEHLIPTSIEGYRVDVRESKPKPLGVPEQLHRPETPGGIRIEGAGGLGTLTGSAWKSVNAVGRWYLVTALHVVAVDPRDPALGSQVYQPFAPNDLVATLSEWVDQNQANPMADAAICEYVDPVHATPDMHDKGPIVGVVDPEINDVVFFLGATTGGGRV